MEARTPFQADIFADFRLREYLTTPAAQDNSIAIIDPGVCRILHIDLNISAWFAPKGPLRRVIVPE
jgi:hypothetical protein